MKGIEPIGHQSNSPTANQVQDNTMKEIETYLAIVL